MTPDYAAPSIPPRNALLAGAPQAAQQPSQPSVNLQGLLANAIGHAALLSDTPERWELTIAMLKQNGVDPAWIRGFRERTPSCHGGCWHGRTAGPGGIAPRAWILPAARDRGGDIGDAMGKGGA